VSKLAALANKTIEQLQIYACSQCGAPVAALSILSPRERQIAKLFAMGMKIKSISGELNVSWKTISTYKCRIREKLNIDKDTDWMDFLVAVRIGELNE
jgi:DNA-binding NarL/FixJ family response regulator